MANAKRETESLRPMRGTSGAMEKSSQAFEIAENRDAK